MQILFPHEKPREIQKQLIELVLESIRKENHLIIHAPTGTGKTAATISPAITYALANDLKVIFLTSRNTQHLLAIETLKKIQQKTDTKITVTDVIGRKWMCAQPGADIMRGQEFRQFCESLIENKKCEFYTNLKDKENLSVRTKEFLKITKEQIMTNQELKEKSSGCKLCPYEIATLNSKNSQIIIADFNHLFDPSTRDQFLKKTNTSLSETIVIIDEGHNLPERIRSMASKTLTTVMLERAINEAEKANFEEETQTLIEIRNTIENIRVEKEEQKITKQKLKTEIEKIKPYTEIITDLAFAAEKIKKEKNQSYISGIANFLEYWLGPDDGYVRIIKKEGKRTIIDYKFLDPSIIAKDVITTSHSTIMMSGTLQPTKFYSQLLGFPESKTTQKSFTDPFPKKNKMILIIPKTTTKYTERSPMQFQKITETLLNIMKTIKGNKSIFLPSYDLLNEIITLMIGKTTEQLYIEKPDMTKQEKELLLKQFIRDKEKGGTLIGVVGGNFSEGIDLPGEELKASIIVGIPLTKPNLETKELINYYDRKHGKGWDYGYLYPAMNKAIQSAGRCIRTETDRGAIIFLDIRYADEKYYKLLPKEWDLKITQLYQERLEEFFSQN